MDAGWKKWEEQRKKRRQQQLGPKTEEKCPIDPAHMTKMVELSHPSSRHKESQS